MPLAVLAFAALLLAVLDFAGFFPLFAGAEVIHLGHNCSVDEVVNAAIEEDAQAIALSSYQGGHIEYFKYMIDLLKELGRPEIKVFAVFFPYVSRNESFQQEQSRPRTLKIRERKPGFKGFTGPRK